MLKELVSHPDVVETMKVAPVGAFSWLTWSGIQFDSLIHAASVVGAVVTFAVALEKVFKYLALIYRKFRKPE